MPLAQSYEQARIHVEQLVERFDRNLALYKRPSYKGARVRVEFIDPFFEALRQAEHLFQTLLHQAFEGEECRPDRSGQPNLSGLKGAR